MKYYLSPTGGVYAYELDGSQDHLISAEFTPITNAQFDTLMAPKPLTVAQQLVKLDNDNELTQRNLRESIMLMAQAIKTLNPAVDLTTIPGVAKVFEVEAQAAVLRGQL